MLLERVRSAIVPLRAHFQALAGKSIGLSGGQMNAISNTVVSILVAPSVAKVFSVSPAVAQWPFGSDDPNGAKLVEIVGTTLPLPQDCKLSYTKFILLQRVAPGGRADAAAAVLTANLDKEQDLLALISPGLHLGHVAARLPAAALKPACWSSPEQRSTRASGHGV